jgi:hypothetical protein
MISREELLDAVEEGIRTEETALPLFAKYVSVPVAWLNFSDEEIARIHRTLKKIAGDCRKHRARLERIRAIAEKGGRDVY